MEPLVDIPFPPEKKGKETAKSNGEGLIAAERRVDLIPTGSTLLNLALSDNPYGGYPVGSIINVVGDRSAGKTFLSWNMMAEVVLREEFDNYHLEYEDIEGKFRIPTVALFGAPIRRVVLTPEEDAVGTVEGLDKKVNKLLKSENPFIYVPDSFDALSDAEEMDKEELKRDYPAKPRLASAMFRRIAGKINKTGSLLLVVSQVRQNIGVTFGEKYSRSGGKALGHYAVIELWLAVKGHIKRKERDVGVKVKAKTKKNHLTGKLRTIEFDILFDYGVDDVGSMIDFLVNEGFWKKKKGGQKIETGGDFTDATREKLIKSIDDNSTEAYDSLVTITWDCWNRIEHDIRTDRKPRYE